MRISIIILWVLFIFMGHYASSQTLHTVNISGFDCDPNPITIMEGDTVEWVNLDAYTHTSTSGTPGNPTGVWDSGNLSQGMSYKYKFLAPGHFDYYCELHSGFMRDYIVNVTAIQANGEVDIEGNSTSIADGDVTPSLGDDTDFGSVSIGATATNTFTIQNEGTSDLTLSGGSSFVTITGSSLFTITSQPSSPISAAGSTTFNVQFNAACPNTAGTYNATVSVSSDDADESPYTFAITAVITGVDTDSDGALDPCDADDDNDGIADGSDPDDTDFNVCGDSDADGCDDCSVTNDGFGGLSDSDPLNDGTDTDCDGVCDATDSTDDAQEYRGNMLSFDGTDDYVSIGNVAEMDFGKSDGFTVEAWINSSSTSTAMQIISKCEGDLFNATGWGFQVGGSSLALYMAGGSIFDYMLSKPTGNPNVKDGLWHHVAVVYDGSNNVTGCTFYIDGVAYAGIDGGGPVATVAGTVTNSESATIGACDGAILGVTEYWDGSLDEVRVWDDVRTQTEIRENLHLSISGACDASNVGYWKFNELTGTTAFDLSRNGNDGTLVGGLSFECSEASVGKGVATTHSATATVTNYTSPSLWSNHDMVLNFASTTPGGEIVVTFIDELPFGGAPGGALTNFSNSHWIVDNYGPTDSGMDATMQYNFPDGGITTVSLASYNMHKRGSNDIGVWTQNNAFANAASTIPGNNSIEFASVTDFSMFMPSSSVSPLGLDSGGDNLPGFGGACTPACTDPDVPTPTASASPVCPGASVTLDWTGDALNDATNWHVYTTSCGVGQLGASQVGTSLVVSPAVTTTYYIRGEDGAGCVDESTGACGSVTVNVMTEGSSSCPIGWVGTTSTDWNTTTNWSSAQIPTASDYLTIPSAPSNQPHVTLASETPAVCADLTVESGATLTINAGKALTVSGTTANAGTILIKADATDIGSFIVNGTISGAGSFQMEQYLTGAGGPTPSGLFYYVSSPAVGATASSYNMASGNKLWSANESTQSYTQLTNGSTVLNPLQGYVARMGSSETQTLTGTSFNTGNQSATGLTRTETTAANRGYNLVGNPYPSTVSWDNATKTNLESTMWYRTHQGTTMLYDTYNSVGSIGTNNNLGGAVTGAIPPTQAFWVRVDADGNTGQLDFTNAMLSHGTQTGIYRMAAEEGTLQMTLSNGINSDETIVFFNSDANDLYDPFDSQKYWASLSIPQLYTAIGTDSLVINGMNSIVANPVVDLGVKLPEAGEYSFNATSITLNENVYLEDRDLGLFQHLNTEPTYAFASTVAGNIPTRFALHFGMSVTGMEDATSNVGIYSSGKQVTILLNGTSVGTVEVLDMTGRMVHTQNVNSAQTIIDLSTTSGIYLVSVQTEGNTISRKVSIR